MPKKKKNDKENIIVYDNTFNKTSLTIFTKIQINVLFAVLSYMRDNAPKNANEYKAVFDFNKIRERSGNKNLHTSRIKSALDKLLKTQIEYYRDGEFTVANVFSHYKVNDDGKVEIGLTPYMGEKLNLKSHGYTILNLDDFVMIENAYAKDLYRLLRQFKHTGLLSMRKKDFLKFFNPPKSYNEYDIIRKILMPAIEDNKKYFENLKVNIEDNKVLPEVLCFTFKKHEKKLKEMSEREFSKLTPEEKEIYIYIENNTIY